jgi:hypothetical protein
MFCTTDSAGDFLYSGSYAYVIEQVYVKNSFDSVFLFLQ